MINQEQNFPTVADETDLCQVSLLKPRQKGAREGNIRWLALAFACMSCFGVYYSNNIFQVLQPKIMDELHITVLGFNVMSSIASIPNIFIPFFAGLIIDIFGVRPAYTLFASLIILAQAIITFGASQHSYYLMLVGKIISSPSTDCIILVKTVMITKWFLGKELSFSLGLGLCVARIGSTFNSVMAPIIITWDNELYLPFLVGTFVCVFSLMATLAINYLDERAEIQDAEFVQAQATKRRPFKFEDIRNLPLLYYFIALNAACVYSGFFSFTDNVNDMMVKRFNIPLGQAGDLTPIIYICGMIISPLLGLVADKIGMRPRFLMLSSVIFIFVHLGIASLPNAAKGVESYDIVFGLLGAGVFYGLFSAIYPPCVALVVDEKTEGGCIRGCVFLPKYTGSGIANTYGCYP